MKVFKSWKKRKPFSLRLRLTFLITTFVVGSILGYYGVSVLNVNYQYRTNFVVNLAGLDNETLKIEEGPPTVTDGQAGVVFFDKVVEEELDRAYKRYQQIAIALTIIFVVLASIIAYFVAGRALRPIEKFRKELQDRDIKNLDAPFEEGISTPFEIRALQNSFSEMSERVKESYALQESFANNAAHELKTPLATMKSGLQLIKMEGDSLTREELEDSLDRIDKQVNRFSSIIEDLELLVEQNALIEKNVIPLFEFTEEILNEYKEFILEKKIDSSLENDGAFIYGSRSLLYYALRNLIENAVKYGEENGKITVFWRVEELYCYIYVENTGPTIPVDNQNHIFQPFYRVDDSRSRDTGGSGLGLSIVANVMAKYKGKVKLVYSKDNKTMFSLKIPLQ